MASDNAARDLLPDMLCEIASHLFTQDKLSMSRVCRCVESGRVGWGRTLFFLAACPAPFISSSPFFFPYSSWRDALADASIAWRSLRLASTASTRGADKGLTRARLRTLAAADTIDVAHTRSGPDNLWFGRFLQTHGAQLTALQTYVCGRAHAASLADTLAATTPRLRSLKLVLTGGMPRSMLENGRASWTTLAPLAALPLHTLDLDWACVGAPCPLTALTELVLWLPHRAARGTENVPPSVRRLSLVDLRSYDVDDFIDAAPRLRDLCIAAVQCVPRGEWPPSVAQQREAAVAGPLGGVTALDILDADDDQRAGRATGGRLPPAASRFTALRSLSVRGSNTRRPVAGAAALRRIPDDTFHLRAAPDDGFGGLHPAACDTLTSLSFDNVPVRHIVWPARPLAALRRLTLYRVGTPRGGFQLDGLAAIAGTLRVLAIGFDPGAMSFERRFDVGTALACRLPALKVLVLDHAQLACVSPAASAPPTDAAAAAAARAFAPRLQSAHFHACETEGAAAAAYVRGLQAACARWSCVVAGGERGCSLYGGAPLTLASELCGRAWIGW